MASLNEPIKLIIRTANNQHADFDLELLPLLTIYDLKQKITIHHPTKPVPKDQRLIFSGKLLDDSMILNQIFLKPTSGSSFMIHLVLNSDKNSTTPKPSQSTLPPIQQQATSLPSQQSSSSIDPPNILTHSSTYEQYLEELNKYQQQLQQFLSNPNGIPSMANSETQAYLQYCYTHYQMYQNFLAYQRTFVPPSATNSIPTQQSDPTTTTVPPPPPPPAPQPAGQAAGAGNNNNEFEQENDLLGILNMLVELFVLCSIIYFYSTFSRFLVVFLIFTLLYLHCRGYLSLQRRRRVQPQPVPVAPEAAAAENDVEDEAEVEPMANDIQNQNDNQRPVRPPPAAPFVDDSISTTRLLLTAVTTFFSSLIPERPQRT